MLLSVNLFMSLDGVSQAPGGPDEDTRGSFTNGGWLMSVWDEGCGQAVSRWFDNCGALLLGRYTYDTFASYWPKITDPDDPVSGLINNNQKYVVTSSPVGDAWAETTTVLGDDFLDEIARLKGVSDSKELQVHGSIQLARTLHQEGMVDLYRFLVVPVTIGPGFGIFDQGGPTYSMRVVHGVVTQNGIYDVEMTPQAFEGRKTVAIDDGKEVVIETEQKAPDA